LAEAEAVNTCYLDFSTVIPTKMGILLKAYGVFKGYPTDQAFIRFREDNSSWLPDYALFMALKDYYGGLPWQQWDVSLATRKEEVLAQFRSKLQEQVEFHYFLQYIFACQWQNLRSYANSRGVKIIGDLPIFVAADSSDTWVASQYFTLDAGGNPTKVAGVPPDYFSNTGQRWGNPLYRWDIMKEDEYLWWRERIKHLLGAVDYIRIDHFRGFEAYWEIPSTEETAVNGQWVKGPGEQFFAMLEKHLGQLPIIAEDLGYITAEVHALKNTFGFPGMKVLQFISEEEWPSKAENQNIVYYTGTHDNDTLLGWYQDKIQSLMDRPLDNANIGWEFIETLYRSGAAWVVTPIQDILGLGTEARMNIPGTPGGNWRWRLQPDALTEKTTQRVVELTLRYCR